MTRDTDWSEEELEILRAVCADRGSAGECSRKLAAIGKDRTRNACIGKAKRLDLHFGGGATSPAANFFKSPEARARLSRSLKESWARRRAAGAIKSKRPACDLPEPEFVGPPNDIPAGEVCRAIKGDPLNGEWQYCGNPADKVDGKPISWCPYHRHRFTTPNARNAHPFPAQMTWKEKVFG